MRVGSKRILRTLFHLIGRFGKIGLAQEYAGDEPPLRSELFSSDQMKRHGEALANSHQLSLGRASDRLLTRLAENESVLIGARNLSDHWVDQITEIAEKDPKNLILVTADMARSKQSLTSSFVAEFSRRLKGQSPTLALPLTWIEQRLSESGLTIEQVVQAENRQQAADQVSLSNSIGSLRFLGAIDWREFVETMSAVEQGMRKDPGAVYGRMDVPAYLGITPGT